VRKGEIFFNDAALCFQHWQSCASCHPDARVDGLNWDLLNDGIGNPKNTKSMLLSHQTPPAMSLGIRDKAETAVRAGIRFIQFAERPEEDAQAIDSYLKSLTPVPSPRLENGALRPEAERGRAIFERAGCAACHMAPLYTDLEPYDVGTVQGMDAGKPVDTPTLVEIWRTAPYLHDGRAATLRDVFVRYNPDDKHGKTSGLTAEEMGDLIAFMLSL
jgi:cytochrome c peroxidase